MSIILQMMLLAWFSYKSFLMLTRGDDTISVTSLSTEFEDNANVTLAAMESLFFFQFQARKTRAPIPVSDEIWQMLDIEASNQKRYVSESRDEKVGEMGETRKCTKEDFSSINATDIYEEIFNMDANSTLICVDFKDAVLANTTQTNTYQDLKIEVHDCNSDSRVPCALAWKRKVWREAHVLKSYAIHKKVDFID